MNLKNLYNKLSSYVKTYGLIKGFKQARKQNKIHKQGIKDLENLPLVESKMKDIIIKYSKQKIENKFDESQKNIFFFWWDGIDNAPNIVKTCYSKIKINYPDFKLIVVDKNNYNDLVNIHEDIIKKFENKEVTIQTFSDILRFKLLSTYGGVWFDSTLFIYQKFDILNNLNEFSFVTAIDKDTSNFINYDNIQTSWSSFCIGGSKDNLLFHCMNEMYEYYILQLDLPIYYFLIDMFLTLCKKYKVNNGILNKYSNINIKTSLFYMSTHLNEKVDSNILKDITLQKLNWRINLDKYKDNIYASLLKENL